MDLLCVPLIKCLKLCVHSYFIAGFVSPRRNLVAETPCHKQVSHVLRYKPSKQDQDGDMPETGEEVVEESPVKQVQGQLWSSILKSIIEKPCIC